MPSPTLSVRVHTKAIGDELARLIRTASGAFGTGLKLCQFGQVIRRAVVEAIDTYLPAVIVKPEEAIWEEHVVGGAEQHYRVRERFRICYLFSYEDQTVDAQDKGSDDLDSLAQALASKATLADLTLADGQVEGSDPLSVVWEPEEDILFAQAQSAVKVDVLRWEVRWLSR